MTIADGFNGKLSIGIPHDNESGEFKVLGHDITISLKLTRILMKVQEKQKAERANKEYKKMKEK